MSVSCKSTVESRRFADGTSSHATMKRTLLPLVRGYIRYSPFAWLKRSLFERFFWHSTSFCAKTQFGSLFNGSTDDLIQRYIYYFGIWEPQLTGWIKQTLKPGDTFVDVGANIGYFTILASKCVGPNGNVIAIEASPSIFCLLQDSITLNRCNNITSYNCAAGDEHARVTIYKANTSNCGASSIMGRRRGDELAEAVIDMYPLDTLLNTSDTQSIRIVKVDVEGAELKVANGLANLLACDDFRADVIMEISPATLEMHGTSYSDIADLFATYGYFPYLLQNDYSHGAYIDPPVLAKPSRLRGIPTQQTDVIFSRTNQEYL